MTKQLITRAEAALRLGVSTKTIQRYEKQGRLIAIRLSSHVVRYDAADLEKLIQQSAILPQR